MRILKNLVALFLFVSFSAVAGMYADTENKPTRYSDEVYQKLTGHIPANATGGGGVDVMPRKGIEETILIPGFVNIMKADWLKSGKRAVWVMLYPKETSVTVIKILKQASPAIEAYPHNLDSYFHNFVYQAESSEATQATKSEPTMLDLLDAMGGAAAEMTGRSKEDVMNEAISKTQKQHEIEVACFKIKYMSHSDCVAKYELEYGLR